MNTGVLVLIIYAIAMMIATVTLTKKEKNVEQFCVGDRKGGWFTSALSIAATWIWAPALFTSAEKAYTNGFAGLFWFLVPNVACLILFIPFAKRIRKEMPEGITLSGYMYEKYNEKTVRNMYLFQLGALSILSTGVQLLAGSKLLSALTGIPFWIMTIIMASVAYSYSQFSGIRASITTDALQMIFMLVTGIGFVIYCLSNGGFTALSNGLGGFTGEFHSLISKNGLDVFLGFGLPTTIGLLSGPFGDQCFWQRAFCTEEKHIGRAFFVGAVLFGLVPLSMGILGFIAAGDGFVVHDIGVLNFEVISEYLPGWCIIPFLFMIVSGLLSTIDSNLCAISSLTTDFRTKRPMEVAKGAMILLLILGCLVANIPGLTVTHLFLFYGTLRAATLLPTIFTLKGVKISSEAIVKGIKTALIIGLPIFAFGNILDIAMLKTAGSLITVLTSGVLAVIITKMETSGGNSKWKKR